MLKRIILIILKLSPFSKKWFWEKWYDIFAKKARNTNLRLMNYGYHAHDFELNLSEEDYIERYPIQLYHFVTSHADIKDKNVLEVGSGRGGGASYIARYLSPSSITGVDISNEAVALCSEFYDVPNLNFICADSESLPFPDNSFDVLVNVESSHCYGNMERFLSEVSRVVKPGGYFGWADLRAKDMVKETEFAFEKSNLTCIYNKTITPEVINALDDIHDTKMKMINNHVPKFLRSAFTDFAGAKNSKIYNSFKSGDAVYLSIVLKK